jgi:FkbM family methyltransferase
MVEAMMHYELEFGLWWPDSTRNSLTDIRHMLRTIPNLQYASSICKQRRVVIQAGGHAGLIPRELAKTFDQVYTAEPHPASWACMAKNTVNVTNIRAYCAAFGAKVGTAKMRFNENAATSKVDPNGAYEVNMHAIDALSLKHVDAIFLDVEGHELEVLKGAEQTIAKWKPVIQVELWPDHVQSIHAFLTQLGYRYMRTVGRDGVFRHGKGGS